MEIIGVRQLSHSYGNKRVLEDVSFSIMKGSITGLLGKNGTGKTTIINIINGFLTPSQGQALLFGEDVQHLSNEIKCKVGFLIEGHVQYDFMNIEQIEKFYSRFYPKWNQEKYFELVDLLKLNKKHKISNMSCGQRSQVALGLIFAQQPELIILDDFSMGLDPGYRRLFIDYLQHYVRKEKTTVFVTSHIVQDMEKLIDEVMIMNHHSIQIKMPLKEFMNETRLYALPKGLYTPDLKNRMKGILNIEELADEVHLFSNKSLGQNKFQLKNLGIDHAQLTQLSASLEDAFIGLTGRY